MGLASVKSVSLELLWAMVAIDFADRERIAESIESEPFEDRRSD
jgi:hypothetical protein